jgi:hypothetical protein
MLSLDAERAVIPLQGHPTGALGDYAGCMATHHVASEYDPNANGVIITSKGWGNNNWSGHLSFRRITDGLSKTIFCGEKHVVEPEFGYHYGDASIYNGGFVQPYARLAGGDPTDNEPDFPIAGGPDDGLKEFELWLLSHGGRDQYQGKWAWLFGSWHPGVCQFGLCDGSVQSLSTSVDLVMYGRLAARDDGQPIDTSRLE